MLIRQYNGYYRADVPGLKAGSHTIKVVPLNSGKEDASKGKETTVSVTAHDRTGFGWVNGSSSGAYNDDGTLRSGAVVLYVTNDTKDKVSLNVVTDSKGGTTAATGIQNILTAYQKGYDTRPLDIRCIGNITDPATLMDGDLLIKGNGASKRLSAGVTVEGIGTDTVFNGFGLRIANASNVEVRNIGFMNCNSGEGDDVGLQQNNDHVWVHNCDMFYGDAGSDADQVKGDGALDTKTSTYITHSFNHFWDNGKCNLQGMKSETTENYITYHHNWYDHSDSRHPRIRTCSVHIYNNYFDGNAKYGVGVTMGASAFVENNYFRNCKYPMLSSMQGSDVATGGTFSGETGGIIKAYGNYMTGQKGYTTYQQNNTDFDAYEAKSANEQVPASVKTKEGSTSYNNFDTNASIMYKYTPESPENAQKTVMANAGRVQGGDFKWKFDNATADASYAVDTALKAALVAYKDSIVAIGSGFTDSTDPSATTPAPTETQPVQTQPTQPTETQPVQTEPTQPAQTDPQPTQPVNPQPSANYTGVIFASPDGKGSGKTENDPTDALTAIKNVPAGGIIYLLGGSYKYQDTIMIDQNNSGESGKYKTIAAYKDAKVTFDFTGQAVDASARGFVLDGSYWHFYGFEIYNAGDNGMLLSGNNNIIEMMVFNDNEDTGLQISRYRTDAANIASWPTNNLVKNCTSKNNCDEATKENADGFAAKLTCGEGNVFDGCISYNNSDDGWDLYAKEATGPIGVVTIKNCIAFRNGFTEDGRGYGDADGNGFKLGGGGVGTHHKVDNCLAFENLNCGFTDNNNPEFGDLTNCTAYNNGIGGNGKGNYFVYRCSTNAKLSNLASYYNTSRVSKTNAPGIKLASDKFVGQMSNSVYFNNNGNYYFLNAQTAIASGDKKGDVVKPADSLFTTLDVAAMGTDFHKAWRNADGSPSPKGFAEQKDRGYHMSGGLTQTATPAISFEAPAVQPTETAPAPTETNAVTTTTTETATTIATETTAAQTETTTVATQPTQPKPGVTLYGDANKDGKLDIMDVIAVNKCILGTGTLDDAARANADVDNSGAVDSTDALNILKAVVGSITLPVA
jgi:pectate lyase